MIDADAAKINGEWGQGAGCPKFVDNGYIHDGDEGKDEKSVAFIFSDLAPGVYDCRVSYSVHSNRATNVPVVAETSLMRIENTVNEKVEPPIDGLFASIGQIKVGDDGKATIVVSAKGTNGYVVVDAAQMVPIE